MQGELLRIEHLSKCSHSQNVLRSVSFQVLPGKKMALLSDPLEKRCIIDILFNGDSPDTGKIFVNERLCGKNIPDSLENSGIYHVSARMSLIPNMTVARNMFLSLPKLVPGVWIKDSVLTKAVSGLLSQYHMQDISPKVRVKDLTFCQILYLEIIIAIQKGAKLIIFDDVLNQIGENGLKDIETMIGFLHEKNIGIMFFANRYHDLFASFDSLVVLQNGVTTGILKQHKISFRNFTRYYSPIEQKAAAKISNKSVMTVKNKELKVSVDRGDILGLWTLDGDYLMRIGQQHWELLSGGSETGQDIAVSMNGYKPDKIYKDMSLIDNITYLANDKTSNAVGIINQRLQQHMAHYVLELIHSQHLIDKYKNKKSLKAITMIDQLKVITAKWLCVSPQVFVYINPFIVLDESTIQEFRDVLQDLAKLKISVIIMSVNRSWLELTCDSVISVSKE